MQLRVDDSGSVTTDINSSEGRLRARYDCRVVGVAVGGRTLELLLPQAADALIDEVAFTADERMPYWAELWPSAVALAEFVSEDPALGRAGLGNTRVLELGCGVGLVSLAVAARGVPVLASDYEQPALDFVEVNARRNGIVDVATTLLDWRDVSAAGTYACVLAADVLYEERNAVALRGALRTLVVPGGSVLLADPGRRWLGAFLETLRGDGWKTGRRMARSVPSSDRSRLVSVEILELARS